MKNLDDLKQIWQKADASTFADSGASGSGKYEVLRGGSISRAVSMKDKLQRRFLRMIRVAGCGMLVGLAMQKMGLQIPIVFQLFYCAFMLTAAILNYVLYNQLRRVDYATMTVGDSIAQIEMFAKRRMRFKMFLIMFAIPVIVGLFVVMNDAGESDLLIAGGVGLIVGASFGIMMNRRFKRDLAALRKMFDPESDGIASGE